MNDQTLVLEEMPIALAKGLAMGYKRTRWSNEDWNYFGLSNWMNGVAVHWVGQDRGPGGLEHRPEVPLTSVESKSRMKNESALWTFQNQGNRNLSLDQKVLIAHLVGPREAWWSGSCSTALSRCGNSPQPPPVLLEPSAVYDCTLPKGQSIQLWPATVYSAQRKPSRQCFTPF